MKTAFIYLAIVNTIDLFVTLAGLELGFIKEANPLMKNLYEWTPVAFIGVKLMFSILLLCMVFLIPLKTTKILKGATCAACLLYTFVMILHSTWIFHVTN
ncbi:hypothetical protein CEF21_15335 [Bacillus sp. FJAT-42376]|uniref:DUF5658 family protein n=1 Tax=Bacillus sp. FJAT-42376 TaxID=2014076 RepID=UPI000F4D6CEF|nr:DUF5658 family protein [Bacillus sp. FJAT-42376]AZB43566.1 hypothetical protein CEF21_15335 [Bacillus sp. FJAT-42376]